MKAKILLGMLTIDVNYNIEYGQFMVNVKYLKPQVCEKIIS